jgi:hypothetical protein
LAFGDFVDTVCQTAARGAPLHILIATDKGEAVFTTKLAATGHTGLTPVTRA